MEKVNEGMNKRREKRRTGRISKQREKKNNRRIRKRRGKWRNADKSKCGKEELANTGINVGNGKQNDIKEGMKGEKGE